MRCSRRSTTWCGSAIALLLAAAAAQAETAAPPASVRAAIEEAVTSRLGADVRVTAHEVTAAGVNGESALVAIADPGARTGSRMGFALSVVAPGAPARRIGSATALVDVEGTHLVAARALPRGTILEDGDLRAVSGPIDDVLLEPLPRRDGLVGARLRRDVGEGQVLTGALVQVLPMVRSGELVTVVARIAGIEAEGRAIASQNGATGDVIRLVNPESRRPLKGRVCGPGRVEVIDESY